MIILFGTLLLLGGIGFLVIPFHLEMTSVVLCLLGMAVLAVHFLNRKTRFSGLADVLTVAAASCVVVLMAGMSLISCYGVTDWTMAASAEYALVLGSGVNEDGSPSRIMRQRISAAMEFMEANPDAVLILTGGQGDYEPVSEAGCMYQVMLELGADPARLLLEEESSTTRENLMNSIAIIEARGDKDQPVGLITSEFHQRRARYIADTLELDTFPVSADTDQWFYRINYTLREVFAFVKAAVQGSV